MTQDKLEYQFKKAFLEQEEGKFIDYLCEKRTRSEVVAAIEKIALIQLQIKNCDDIIYTANIPEFDDPLFQRLISKCKRLQLRVFKNYMNIFLNIKAEDAHRLRQFLKKNPSTKGDGLAREHLDAGIISRVVYSLEHALNEL